MNSSDMEYKEFNEALRKAVFGRDMTFVHPAKKVSSESIEKREEKCGRGSLIVQVSTASGALPIAGAKVIVSEKDGGVISRQYTDNSGRTKSIELAAPAAENSQLPGNSSTYSTYNIIVEKDGYFTEEFLNVAIFDKINSIQPVEMEPLGENAFEGDRMAENQRVNNQDVLIIEEEPMPAVESTNNMI